MIISSKMEGKSYSIGTRNNRRLENPKIEESEKIKEMIESADEIKLTGDWHLWGVDRKTKTFKRGARLDKTIEECKNLKENDLLIFLGDIVDDEFEDKEAVEKVLKLIKCKRIMVLGNNDFLGMDFYERNFDIVVEAFRYEDIIFSHFPILDLTDEINIHGHIHTSSYYHPERCTRNINAFTESGEFISYKSIKDEIESKRKCK